MRRPGITESIEIYYSTFILDALHRVGALKVLQVPQTAAEVAKACGVDDAMVTPLLAFVCEASSVVERQTDGRFRLAGDERALTFVAHMLDQYVGGYGPPLAALATLLRERRTGEALVDLERHAAAFTADPTRASPSEPARIVLDIGATGVVELGCGGGQTLCELATANLELTGIGIDSNPAAVASATALMRARGIADRVEIICGDSLDTLHHIKIDGVQIVLASSLLNAFWRDPGGVGEFLRRLAALLPGRLVLVSDYYSHLTDGLVARASARTRIHDVAQLVSGQGIPPASVQGWAAAYRVAGAELLHDFEASGDGIDRFIHIVRLPEQPWSPLLHQ